jgi:hypothetical protein
MTPKNFVKRNIEKFCRSRSGVAYIWIVAGCTLLFTPLIYWSLGLALDATANTLLAVSPLVGNQLSAWTLVKALVSFTPVIILFTVILWSFINSKTKAYVE